MGASNNLLETAFISNERHWRGPVNALGQGGQRVLVTYGSTYIHVHPSRLALKNNRNNKNNKTKIKNNKIQKYHQNWISTIKAKLYMPQTLKQMMDMLTLKQQTKILNH